MGIFNFFKKKETNNCSDFENLDTSLKHLWNNGTEKQWKMALNGYYNMLKPNQIEIENYMNNINAKEIENLSPQEFYDFLYEKYFLWKFTAKNRLATTRKSLSKFIDNNQLFVLENIQKRIFLTPKTDIAQCLKTVKEIHGLGTSGASGLLAVLFPEYFGAVDQFVVKRLQEIQPKPYANELNNINPDSIKEKDGVLIIEIMQQKAKQLNKQFKIDFWTPRKIDMVLWSFGR